MLTQATRPPYYIYGQCPTCAYANNIQFYHGWSGGHIATTPKIRGSTFRDRSAIDQYCVNVFGPGWQVSSIKDGTWIPGMNGTRYANQEWTANAHLRRGGGWGFYAYGNIRSDTRYWAHIDDQPSTCWQNEYAGRK